MIQADYQALINATAKVKSASPIHYNAKAYRDSEIHKMTKDVKKQSTDYIAFKDQQAEQRRIVKEQEELANRPWYEKTWDVVCNFTGEVSGYYDYKRAADGVDPVTGEKLTEGQRVAAGALAADGNVPIVGWAGKLGKGVKAVTQLARPFIEQRKHLISIKHLRPSLPFKIPVKDYTGLLQQTVLEAVTGRDMFGNKISKERRENSLNSALASLAPIGMIGAGKALKINSGAGKPSNLFRGEDFPYATKRPNGIGKSHISPETGNLVPANKSGMYQGRQVTVTEHILGGYRKGGKSNSPYTSFTINKKIAKGYGEYILFELNIPALRKAIRFGELKGVAILNPKQIERLIKNDTRQTDNWKKKAINGLVEIQSSC